MAANNTPGAITEAQLDAGIAAWFGVTKVSPERAILRERMHAAIVATRAPAALMSDAARDVLAERMRQVETEGWTPAHDDEHGGGEMARAAATYALYDQGLPGAMILENGLRLWPWDWRWLKPKSNRANLVRSGALVVAEIERLDRAALRAAATEETKGGA